MDQNLPNFDKRSNIEPKELTLDKVLAEISTPAVVPSTPPKEAREVAKDICEKHWLFTEEIENLDVDSLVDAITVALAGRDAALREVTLLLAGAELTCNEVGRLVGETRKERDLCEAVENCLTILRTRAEQAEAKLEAVRLVGVKYSGSCMSTRIVEEIEECVAGWHKRAVDAETKLTAAEQRASEAEAKLSDMTTNEEIGEFQEQVRNLVIKESGAPDNLIDGAGSDADWQEFTLAEIQQGFIYLKDRIGELEKALEPFAGMATMFNPGCGDKLELCRQFVDAETNGYAITLGHCRAARAALKGEGR